MHSPGAWLRNSPSRSVADGVVPFDQPALPQGGHSEVGDPPCQRGSGEIQGSEGPATCSPPFRKSELSSCRQIPMQTLGVPSLEPGASPLVLRTIMQQSVHPTGNHPHGRTDAEAFALQPPDAKNWLAGKDPDAGKDWGQEEKGTTEDEMIGWHHWLDGHEFEQAQGVGDGQGGLACCGPWGRRVRHEWATETKIRYDYCYQNLAPVDLHRVKSWRQFWVKWKETALLLFQAKGVHSGANALKIKTVCLPWRVCSGVLECSRNRVCSACGRTSDWLVTKDSGVSIVSLPLPTGLWSPCLWTAFR